MLALGPSTLACQPDLAHDRVRQTRSKMSTTAQTPFEAIDKFVRARRRRPSPSTHPFLNAGT